jgi:hypothetical protein
MLHQARESFEVDAAPWAESHADFFTLFGFFTAGRFFPVKQQGFAFHPAMNARQSLFCK